MAVLLITHDLGVIAETARRVMVMYAGQVVESAAVTALFENAYHPYTRGLLAALPKLTGDAQRLETIPGGIPDAKQMPPGCRFAPRCAFATDRCGAEMPELKTVVEGRQIRCFEWERVARSG